MSPILVATIAGLATAFLWGTADYLAAKSTKKLSSFQVNFAAGVVCVAPAALIAAKRAGAILVVAGIVALNLA